MFEVTLHIPAWYNDANIRNEDERVVALRLPYPPFKGLQITVPAGGCVEVVNVRAVPFWKVPSGQQVTDNNWLVTTEVFTQWVKRPKGAKVLRSRTHA
jgi:hypothetical protein